MFLPNRHADHRKPLDPADAGMLGVAAADEVERHLAHRENHAPTPLHALPALAAELGAGAIHVKDEGFRLGLGSFKALGGAWAVVRLVLEEAGRRLGRSSSELRDTRPPRASACSSSSSRPGRPATSPGPSPQ